MQVISGWDEYIFGVKNKNGVIKEQAKGGKYSKIISVIILGCLVVLSFYFFKYKEEKDTVEIQDVFTKEAIQNDVEAVMIESDTEVPIEIKDAKIVIPEDDSIKIKLKSPFYKEKTVVVKHKENLTVELEPNDYAMMLKGFMKSDIKDWQTRKVQLEKILANDLEVLVMLKHNLGAEYYNKEEFSEKIIVPSATVKKMKIVEIKNDSTNKINFIRITQE